MEKQNFCAYRKVWSVKDTPQKYWDYKYCTPTPVAFSSEHASTTITFSFFVFFFFFGLLSSSKSWCVPVCCRERRVSCATFIRNWKLALSRRLCRALFENALIIYISTTIETRNRFYYTRGTPARIRLVAWSCAKSVKAAKDDGRRDASPRLTKQGRGARRRRGADVQLASPSPSDTHSGVASSWILRYVDCIGRISASLLASFSAVGFKSQRC